MPLFGSPNVKKMLEKKDVEGLIKALGYKKDRFVRKGAAQALGLLGDTRAVEPLIAALEDDDLVAYSAARGLGRIGGARAVEVLITALERPHLSQAAALALADLGDARAVEKLIALLNQDSVGNCVGKSAAEALGRLGDTRAVEPLFATSKSRDHDLAEAAVHALALIGDNRAVDVLVARLPRVVAMADQSVREAAADALVRIGGPAVRSLCAAVKDRDVSRAAVVKALVRIGRPAVEALTTALEDEDEYVREVASRALDRIDSPAID